MEFKVQCMPTPGCTVFSAKMRLGDWKTISGWLFYFCIDSLGRNSFHLHSFLFRLIIKRQERGDMSFYSALYKTSFTFLLNFLPSVLNSLLLLMPLL